MTGAVSFMFERKGLILYSETVISMDEFMELIIEAGGEDLDSDSGDYLVYCDPSELHKVEKALELKLGQSKNSKLIWKPTTVTSLDLDGAKTFFSARLEKQICWERSTGKHVLKCILTNFDAF